MCMQAIEASLSLFVFASILTMLLGAAEEPRGIDDSLYRMQLAQDAWRVLYLRHDFQDFGEGNREAIERDMDEIGEQASLCIFLDGIWSTNCRGGHEGHEMTLTMRRTVVSGGSPRRLVFSLGQ